MNHRNCDTAGRKPYEHLVASVEAHDMALSRRGRDGWAPDARTADERWLAELVAVADSRREKAFRELVEAHAPRFEGSTVDVHYWNGEPCATVRYADGSRRYYLVDPETGRPV